MIMHPPTIRELLLTRRALGWVFVLALAVRIVLLIALHDSYYTADMAQGELARNLAEGRGFVVNAPFSAVIGQLQKERSALVDVADALGTSPPVDSTRNLHPFIAYMMPGQGILLAATYTITGMYRYLPLQILQVLLDSFGVILLYWLATVFLNERVALISSLLLAVYIPEARLAVSATRDAWMPVMYLWSAFFLLRAVRFRHLPSYVLGGVLAGIGVYFRSEFLLLPFFILLIEGLRQGWRFLLRSSLLVAVPLIVLLAPWSIRNYEVFDRFIPLNTGFWVATWELFGEYPNQFGAVNNDVATFQQTREWGCTAPFDSPQYDDIFKPKVLDVVTHHPGWVAWTVVRRAARIPFQMHSWGISLTEEMSLPNEQYPVGLVDLPGYFRYLTSDPMRFVVHTTARGINVLLFLSALVWLFRPGRFSRRYGVLLLMFPLYNILLHAVLGVQARYILPTNTFLLPFAAVFVVDSIEYFGRKRRGNATTSASAEEIPSKA